MEANVDTLWKAFVTRDEKPGVRVSLLPRPECRALIQKEADAAVERAHTTHILSRSQRKAELRAEIVQVEAAIRQALDPLATRWHTLAAELHAIKYLDARTPRTVPRSTRVKPR